MPIRCNQVSENSEWFDPESLVGEERFLPTILTASMGLLSPDVVQNTSHLEMIGQVGAEVDVGVNVEFDFADGIIVIRPFVQPEALASLKLRYTWEPDSAFYNYVKKVLTTTNYLTILFADGLNAALGDSPRKALVPTIKLHPERRTTKTPQEIQNFKTSLDSLLVDDVFEESNAKIQLPSSIGDISLNKMDVFVGIFNDIRGNVQDLDLRRPIVYFSYQDDREFSDWNNGVSGYARPSAPRVGLYFEFFDRDSHEYLADKVFVASYLELVPPPGEPFKVTLA